MSKTISFRFWWCVSLCNNSYKDNLLAIALFFSFLSPLYNNVSFTITSNICTSTFIFFQWIFLFFVRSQHGSKRIHGAATIGYKMRPISPVRDALEVVAILNGQVLTLPIYEVLFVSKTEVPRVANRWTTTELVQEAIELIANAGVQYGYENQPQDEMTVSSKMIKTQEQITSVTQSPEYLLCLEEEKLGNFKWKFVEFYNPIWFHFQKKEFFKKTIL